MRVKGFEEAASLLPSGDFLWVFALWQFSFAFLLFSLSSFYLLFFFLFSLLLSGPAIFSFVSSSPLLSFSGSSVIYFLCLFLLLSPVSSFPSVIISCLFFRLASSSSFTPPLFLFLFSFSLCFVSILFPFLSFRALRSSFPFLSASLFFLVLCLFLCFSVCQSFLFLLASPFLSSLLLLFFGSLYSSAVPLSSAGGSLSLVSPCSPSSPTPCLCLLPLHP